MVTPASSTNFSWSFKLDTFIMLNVLDALNEILQGDYSLNNCYLFIIKQSRYARTR